MRAEASARLKSSKLTMFASIFDSIFQEIGTEQVRQVISASLALVTYAEKDLRALQFYCTSFRAGEGSLAPINRGQLLHTVISSADRDAIDTLNTATPSGFGVPVFSRRTTMIENAIHGKTLKSVFSYLCGTLIYHTMQKISKVWIALAEAANLALVANFVFLISWAIQKRNSSCLEQVRQRFGPP